MNSSLQCPFCSEFFDHKVKKPRLLPICGHSICEVCLQDYFENHQPIVCPEDSQTTNIVNQTMSSFPINATLFDLLENKTKKMSKNITISINNSLSSDSKQTHFNETVAKDESGSDFNIFRHSSKKASFEQVPVESSSRHLKIPSNDVSEDDMICKIHHKKMKTVCMDEDCQKMICSHCGLYGIHRVVLKDPQCHFQSRLR